MAMRWMASLGLLLLLAVPGAAGTPDDDGGPDEADARVRERLLHLVGGGVLRAESRFHDGAWEVRDDEGWRALPSGAVAEARLEKAVLAEMRKRRGLARRAGPAERVAAAEWMVGEGLLTEAFGELEDILAGDRDQPDALALLHAGRLPVAVPPHVPTGASVERAHKHHAALLAWAAPMPVTLHELAAAGLRPDATLREALVGGLRAASPGTRRFCALALRRHFAATPEPELIARALLDRSADVRAEAAWALRDNGDPEGLQLCIDALDHPAGVIRTHAAEALGRMAAPRAVPALVSALTAASTAQAGSGGRRAAVFFGTQRAFVQGYDADVANNAAIADPVIGTVQEGVTLDARVLATGPVGSTAERRAVRSSLETITGERLGSTASAWERWWDRQGESWLAAHVPATEPAPPVAPAPEAPALGDAW